MKKFIPLGVFFLVTIPLGIFIIKNLYVEVDCVVIGYVDTPSSDDRIIFDNSPSVDGAAAVACMDRVYTIKRIDTNEEYEITSTCHNLTKEDALGRKDYKLGDVAQGETFNIFYMSIGIVFVFVSFAAFLLILHNLAEENERR